MAPGRHGVVAVLPVHFRPRRDAEKRGGVDLGSRSIPKGSYQIRASHIFGGADLGPWVIVKSSFQISGKAFVT